MLATLAFGLVLVGAFAAFLVLADSGYRSWVAFGDLRKEIAGAGLAPLAQVKLRNAPRRNVDARPMTSPAIRQRAA